MYIIWRPIYLVIIYHFTFLVDVITNKVVCIIIYSWCYKRNNCDQATPEIWILENSIRSSYTPFQMYGQSYPTCRYVILRGIPTRKHAKCLNAWKSRNISTKEEHLQKSPNLGHMPTVLLVAGNVQGEKLSCHFIGKRKKHYAGHTSGSPTGDKTFLVHIPGHSTVECKVLKGYSNKYVAQRPCKEALSCGKRSVENPSILKMKCRRWIACQTKWNLKIRWKS